MIRRSQNHATHWQCPSPAGTTAHGDRAHPFSQVIVLPVRLVGTLPLGRIKVSLSLFELGVSEGTRADLIGGEFRYVKSIQSKDVAPGSDRIYQDPTERGVQVD